MLGFSKFYLIMKFSLLGIDNTTGITINNSTVLFFAIVIQNGNMEEKK